MEFDGTVVVEAWRGKEGMAPLYIKVLQAVHDQGVGGGELWSQLEMTEQIVRHAGERQGPVWAGLIRQIVAAQGGVPVSIGPELFWAWEEGQKVVDTPLCWRNLVPDGSEEADVTVRMQWAADMPEWWVQQTKDRAASRGRWQWDWYIVPAGSLQSA